jgi:hypothetical protein
MLTIAADAMKYVLRDKVTKSAATVIRCLRQGCHCAILD